MGKTALSNVYQLEASAFVGKSATAIDRLTRDIYLALIMTPGAKMLRLKWVCTAGMIRSMTGLPASTGSSYQELCLHLTAWAPTPSWGRGNQGEKMAGCFIVMGMVVAVLPLQQLWSC